MTNMVGGKGEIVPPEDRRKITEESIQALKDAGIVDPLMDDEPEE